MTEDKLGQKMLEFERSQTKIIRTTGNELLIGKPMRPTLPCDMEEPRPSRTDTGAFTPNFEGARKTRANDQSRLGAATEEKLTQCLWHSSPRRDGWTG